MILFCYDDEYISYFICEDFLIFYCLSLPYYL